MSILVLSNLITFLFVLSQIGTIKSQCLTENDDLNLSFNTDLSQIQDFHLELFRRLLPKDENQNFVFSPYSIWNALIPAYLGSSGQTEEQFRNVLRTEDKLSALRTWREFEMLYLTRDFQENTTFMLANRVYFDKQVRLRRCMKNILHNELFQLDFAADPHTSAEIINAFVNETTKGNIPEIVNAADIQYAYMVLVNAAYFKGAWLNAFDPKDTQEGTFYTHDQQEVKVPMMFRQAEFNYAFDDTQKFEMIELPYVGNTTSMYIIVPYSGDKLAFTQVLETFDDTQKFEMIELPYVGNTTSMYIIVPYSGDKLAFTQVLESLSGALIEKTLSKMSSSRFSLFLPKFSLESIVEKELIQALYGMGLRDPFFSISANFEAFSYFENLKLDDSIHKAFIKVDEEGTEAGAATAFIATKTRPSEFRCDRPFIFVIRDNETKNLLFLGTYKKPEKKSATQQSTSNPTAQQSTSNPTEVVSEEQSRNQDSNTERNYEPIEQIKS